jgi:hypothetical protein
MPQGVGRAVPIFDAIQGGERVMDDSRFAEYIRSGLQAFKNIQHPRVAAVMVPLWVLMLPFVAVATFVEE